MNIKVTKMATMVKKLTSLCQDVRPLSNDNDDNDDDNHDDNDDDNYDDLSTMMATI